MTEDLIQKYAATAIAEASKKSDSPIDDDILAKYAQAALTAKKHKVEQKQQQKETLRHSAPEKRLTIADVEKMYTDTGLAACRRVFFFEERNPCIQAEYVEEPDRKAGTPIGVAVLAKHKEKPMGWVEDPSNTWGLGSIAQATGFSTSYLLGFSSGFDGHAPGHRLCSYDFHCGYADGRVIAALLYKQGKLVETSSQDPWLEVNDEQDLNELVRVQGYWRQEWGPKPKYMVETTDLTSERLKELGLCIDNLSC